LSFDLIRVIRGLKVFLHLPRNLRLNLRLYMRERPEMTFQDGKSDEAKKQKEIKS
jgi:hypothetical protein